MKRRSFLMATGMTLIAATAQGCAQSAGREPAALAREAYVYTFPMVENYLSIYQVALDPAGDQYKGPPNQVHNLARVFTPADRTVVTPNSDTPYSFLIMDLRAEPLVVTMPAIEPDRYYSLQIVDLYSHNVDYLGTRKDGNGGGKFLVAGPGWQGQAPADVRRVVRVPTELVYAQFRTQLRGAADLDRVKEIQAGYDAKPLSAHLGTPPPPPPPAVQWPAISRATVQENFWSYANFLLQFAPPLPWEADLREQFATIGVAPAPAWPSDPGMQRHSATLKSTAETTQAEIRNRLVTEVTSSRGLFGSPEEMRGQYMQRALGAMGGLYGLQEEEALYETYLLDSDGERLDTSKHNYTLRFLGGALPPTESFWSVTMYDKDQFLSNNALNRYLINSSMAAQLKPEANGDIVIYLQNESPGAALESNWLPAPDGEMGTVLRIYLPEAPALDGSWKAPKIEKNPAR